MKFLNYNLLKTLLSLLLFLGCTNAKINSKFLNGYWKIDYVMHKGEKFIPESVNLLYDYYFFKENKGIYKKASPLINGTFETSLDQTSFTLVEENNNTYIKFLTRWDQWSKKISHLDSVSLVLEHDQRQFYYKRP